MLHSAPKKENSIHCFSQSYIFPTDLVSSMKWMNECRLGDRGSNPVRNFETFLFARNFTIALRTTQCPIQRKPGALSADIKRPDREAEEHLHLIPRALSRGWNGRSVKMNNLHLKTMSRMTDVHSRGLNDQKVKVTSHFHPTLKCSVVSSFLVDHIYYENILLRCLHKVNAKCGGRVSQSACLSSKSLYGFRWNFELRVLHLNGSVEFNFGSYPSNITPTLNEAQSYFSDLLKHGSYYK